MSAPVAAPYSPASWQKVAAGVFGAVSSLSLSGLAGFRRYRLTFRATIPTVSSRGHLTCKLNGAAASHYYVLTEVSNTTLNSTVGENAASVILLKNIGNAGAGGLGQTVLDLLIVAPTPNSGQPAINWTASNSGLPAVGMGRGIGGGGLSSGSAEGALGITTILLTFGGGAVTSGDWILTGSNDDA